MDHDHVIRTSLEWYPTLLNSTPFQRHGPTVHGHGASASRVTSSRSQLASWLTTLTVVPLGLGSLPGEDMDVCKCIVPSWHGSTLNSRRSASPLVRLVEREERGEAPDHPQNVLPQNWGETELNRSVPCMVLKATVNGRRHLALRHDECRRP
ncbi:uncharacterized protein TNCV_425631 [Trichonephila clavipes]|nr:uncharacterized protein TNCV_425631 [Trichonephila clavipes]